MKVKNRFHSRRDIHTLRDNPGRNRKAVIKMKVQKGNTLHRGLHSVYDNSEDTLKDRGDLKAGKGIHLRENRI